MNLCRPDNLSYKKKSKHMLTDEICISADKLNLANWRINSIKLLSECTYGIGQIRLKIMVLTYKSNWCDFVQIIYSIHLIINNQKQNYISVYFYLRSLHILILVQNVRRDWREEG